MHRFPLNCLSDSAMDSAHHRASTGRPAPSFFCFRFFEVLLKKTQTRTTRTLHYHTTTHPVGRPSHRHHTKGGSGRLWVPASKRGRNSPNPTLCSPETARPLKNKKKKILPFLGWGGEGRCIACGLLRACGESGDGVWCRQVTTRSTKQTAFRDPQQQCLENTTAKVKCAQSKPIEKCAGAFRRRLEQLFLMIIAA